DTTSWENGQVTEHCGELIDSTHKTILGLAKRFDIDVADLIGAEPPQATTTYYFFGQYYLRSQANDDFDHVYQAVKADLNAAGYPTLYNNFTSAAFVLDNLSVYDWIEDRVEVVTAPSWDSCWTWLLLLSSVLRRASKARSI